MKQRRFWTTILALLATLSVMFVGVLPVSAKVLYENQEVYEGMNPADGEEAVDFKTDKAYGKEFVLEAVIHVNSIGDGDGRGVKFVLGASKDSTSGDLELWIGKSAIWACTNEWKGHKAFDFSPYIGKDTAVKIIAEGSKLVLSLDGKEVWSAEDTTFASATESPVRLGGWDAKYILKSIKLSDLPSDGGETQPSGDGEEEDSPLPAGVLYYTNFNGTPYEGMNPADGEEAVDFKTDKAYGKEFVLEAVIHVNSIGDGDGRGVKFVLGASKESTSGDLELWIGKSAIWACTNEWKGHKAFDFSPYIGKDITVKIVAEGGKLILSLDGKEVWSGEDATFTTATESPIRLSGWDAKYLIKEVKISQADTADVNPDTGAAANCLPVLIMLAGAGLALAWAKKK